MSNFLAEILLARDWIPRDSVTEMQCNWATELEDIFSLPILFFYNGNNYG